MKENKKALLLVSGGIDSPVAGKLAIEKGYELTAIHFSQEPFTDSTPRLKSIALCKLLGLKEMIVINAGEEFKEIADKSYREYYFILIKRFMMKVAEKVAEEKGINYLITGESMGQVSSQTLSNLNTINQSTKIEILRPVLFMNKQEIINLSKNYNYFETSKGPEMCDALASGSPRTQSTIEQIAAEEEKCKMNELVQTASKKVTIEETNQKIELPQSVNICK
jgi:thiamine biosynthesis protein ThiI